MSIHDDSFDDESLGMSGTFNPISSVSASASDTAEILDTKELDHYFDIGLEQMHDRINACAHASLLRVGLKRSIDEGTCTPESLRMANVAFELICSNARHVPKSVTYSGEEFTSHADASLEQMSTTITNLGEEISKNMVKMTSWLSTRLSYYKRNIELCKIELADLKRKAGNIKNSTTPRFDHVKPAEYCKNLLYLEKGFDKGLTNVLPDIDKLLTGHKSLVLDNTQRMISWLEKNAARAATDAGVFTSFAYDPKQFVMPNSSRFNRDVDELTQSDTEGFYRSQELPGGMAVFSYVPLARTTGLEAIHSCSAVYYTVKPYDPASYHRMKMLFITALGAGIMFSPASIMTMGASAAIGAYLGNKVAKRYSKIEGTGTQQVSVSNEMLFDVLTRKEIDSSIRKIEDAISSLESWHNTMIDKVWTAEAFDKILKKSMKDYTNSSSYDRSSRLLFEACMSIDHYRTTRSGELVSYCFDVLTSVMKFTNKSIDMYE